MASAVPNTLGAPFCLGSLCSFQRWSREEGKTSGAHGCAQRSGDQTLPCRQEGAPHLPWARMRGSRPCPPGCGAQSHSSVHTWALTYGRQCQGTHVQAPLRASQEMLPVALPGAQGCPVSGTRGPQRGSVSAPLSPSIWDVSELCSESKATCR